MRRRIIICPDSFKGTLSASEAAEAIREGIMDSAPDSEVVLLPIGDGGEGTSNAITSTLEDYCKITADTIDPIHRPIKAGYYLQGTDTAVIESAAASGLTLLAPSERDIMTADTAGTGLLILDAYAKGARNFIICMGGTATCDGGRGAYEVLKKADIGDASFTLLCDVETPLCGVQGAASVFGPQKGALPHQIPVLDRRLRELAEEYSSINGKNVADEKFAGAAGGLAGMLMACFDAVAVAGADEVLKLVGFRRALKDADLVITGEGKADRTTLTGKAAFRVLQEAGREGVPVVLIAGCVEDCEALMAAGFGRVVQATPDGMEPDADPKHWLRTASARLIGEVDCFFVEWDNKGIG